MKRPTAGIPYLADTFYYSARDADAYMDYLEAENKRLRTLGRAALRAVGYEGILQEHEALHELNAAVEEER